MTRRTIIITGGSRGIGASISTAFYATGNHVVIASRSDNGMARTLGDRACFVVADVRKPKTLHDLVRQTIDWTGQLDVLVNNAGVSAWRPLAAIDELFWQEMIDTNLKGTLFASQAAAAVMLPGSSIINISSLAGKRGSANNSVYCAAKFGVNGVTQALAKELGPFGIRVNAVCPVYVSTPGLEAALNQPQSPSAGQDLASYLSDFSVTQTALGVLPTAAQVASSCVFLASTAADAITGQCINVDCGVMPQ